MSHQSKTISSDESALIWSAQEAARALRVSARTLWTHTTNGDIPHIRLGRRVLYPVDELRLWMRRKMEAGSADTAARV